jgi:hypothetical protein
MRSRKRLWPWQWILGGLFITACHTEGNIVKRESDDVLTWASSQGVAPGDTRSLRLPDNLVHSSADGSVLVAALHDGRHCTLLKKKIGHKDNFEGMVACSAAVGSGEIAAHGSPPREYLSFPGHGVFEELYIRKRIDDRTFEVYFDLN